jgi:hypothetical protein
MQVIEKNKWNIVYIKLQKIKIFSTINLLKSRI